MTKKKKAILIIVLIVVVLGICAGTFLYFKDKEEQKKKLIREEKALVEKIKNSYSKYVVVSNAFLYKKIDNNYFAKMLYKDFHYCLLQYHFPKSSFHSYPALRCKRKE